MGRVNCREGGRYGGSELCRPFRGDCEGLQCYSAFVWTVVYPYLTRGPIQPPFAGATVDNRGEMSLVAIPLSGGAGEAA